MGKRSILKPVLLCVSLCAGFWQASTFFDTLSAHRGTQQKGASLPPGLSMFMPAGSAGPGAMPLATGAIGSPGAALDAGAILNQLKGGSQPAQTKSSGVVVFSPESSAASKESLEAMRREMERKREEFERKRAQGTPAAAPKPSPP